MKTATLAIAVGLTLFTSSAMASSAVAVKVKAKAFHHHHVHVSAAKQVKQVRVTQTLAQTPRLQGKQINQETRAAKMESTDKLDPLGTSELSGSGDIIIYRDRYGNIEGTSQTHQ